MKLGRDPCEECARAHADGLITVQDCSACKTIRLTSENQTAWTLFLESMPLLFDGMGGVNSGIIESFINMYGIRGWLKRDTMIKIVAIVAVLKENQGKDS